MPCDNTTHLTSPVNKNLKSTSSYATLIGKFAGNIEIIEVHVPGCKSRMM
jgi:hypothetical protein